jgi:hypothetical protein
MFTGFILIKWAPQASHKLKAIAAGLPFSLFTEGSVLPGQLEGS